MIISFSHPSYLFLLFVIPVFFLIHFLSLNNRKRAALKFANFDAIARIEGVDFFSKNITILFLSLFIVLFMIFAVSGLTLGVIKESSSFSFVLAIDCSQSMQVNDFVPDRLTVSKQVAEDFIDTIPYGVNLGVVSFSGTSYIEQDISQNKGDIKNAIENIEISEFGGTDLYEAIITSINLLKNEENKAIILLSDGQINVGTIEEAINYANANDVIVHTIAIGTKEGGEVDNVISKLDEDSLKSIAYMTEGTYFTVEDRDALVDSFAEILSLTEKNVSIDVSNYLIFFAIVLFVIKFFLINTRYFNLP